MPNRKMESTAQDELEVGRLRKQRNLFTTVTAVLLGSIALAVPRRVASHGEMKALNAHLVELQAEIVEIQRQIRVAENQIFGVQDEIRKRQAK